MNHFLIISLSSNHFILILLPRDGPRFDSQLERSKTQPTKLILLIIFTATDTSKAHHSTLSDSFPCNHWWARKCKNSLFDKWGDITETEKCPCKNCRDCTVSSSVFSATD